MEADIADSNSAPRRADACHANLGSLCLGKRGWVVIGQARKQWNHPLLAMPLGREPPN